MSLSPETLIQKYNQIQICKKKMATALCEIVDALSASPKELKAAGVYSYLIDGGFLFKITAELNLKSPVTMFIFRKNQTYNYDGVHYLTFAFVFYGEEGKIVEDTAYIAYAETAKGTLFRSTNKSPYRLNCKLYRYEETDDLSPMSMVKQNAVWDTALLCQEQIIKLSGSLSALTTAVGYECVPEKLRESVINLQDFVD